MFNNNNQDSSSATRANPALRQQKQGKEKTAAIKPATNAYQIDVTKPLTQQEMAILAHHREQQGAEERQAEEPAKAGQTIQETANSAETSVATPVQVQPTNTPPPNIPAATNAAENRTAEKIAREDELLIAEPLGATNALIELSGEAVNSAAQKEASEKAQNSTENKNPNIISSIVGEYDPVEGKNVNLGADVALVQNHLLRLNILSKEDFEAEKITTIGAVAKATIPKTIKAIWTFQQDVLGYTGDGYATPGEVTIKNLDSLKPEDVILKKAQVVEKRAKEAAQAEEAEKARQKAIDEENLKKVQEQFLIIFIAREVHDGIYGAGTNEKRVYKALEKLKNDNALIKKFKEQYTKLYNADIVNDIEGDFSFSEENRALAYLNIGSYEEEIGKEEDLQQEDAAKLPTKVKKDLGLREKGTKLLENKYYHKHYAYIPFTGKITGTSYKKGDYIAKEDRAATYGSESKPTWCNMFARDLIKEVIGTDVFDGDKSAKQIHAYIKENPNVFHLLDLSFEDAWNNEINKHEIVFLVDDGHIAVGVPTELTKKHIRTYIDANGKKVTKKIGYVIQAGKSHGDMILSEAWGKPQFRNIKMYKYVTQ